MVGFNSMTRPEFLLLVETGFSGLGLILFKKNQSAWLKVDQVWQNEPQAATRFISFSCRAILSKHSLESKHLTGVVFNVGPGSFTGIKIGLAFVSGLKAGCSNVRLYPINTLSLLQHQGAAFFGKNLREPFVFHAATRTQGYCALTLGLQTGSRVGPWSPIYQTTLAACSVEEEQISFRFQEESGYDLSFKIPQDSTCILIDSWPLLEERLVRMGLHVIKTSSMDLLEVIEAGVLQFLRTGMLAQSDILPKPVFLRRSAPEEKMLPAIKA